MGSRRFRVLGSKTKPAIKDDNLDAEDSTTSSPPNKISKKNTTNATAAGTATALTVATAAVVSANKSKPSSPPPSPEKARKAAATMTESPASQTIGHCESDHPHSGNGDNNGNGNGSNNDTGNNDTGNGGNNDEDGECNNNDDDDDNNISNSCGGVQTQHQLLHKRRRRSVTSFKTPKTVAQTIPPTSCKMPPVSAAAVAVMTEIKQLPKARQTAADAAVVDRADIKLPAPLTDVDVPPTLDSDNKIVNKGQYS